MNLTPGQSSSTGSEPDCRTPSKRQKASKSGGPFLRNSGLTALSSKVAPEDSTSGQHDDVIEFHEVAVDGKKQPRRETRLGGIAQDGEDDTRQKGHLEKQVHHEVWSHVAAPQSLHFSLRGNFIDCTR